MSEGVVGGDGEQGVSMELPRSIGVDVPVIGPGRDPGVTGRTVG
ncbi:hypothetical protein [Streptomyces sp. NPDC020742]